MADSDHIQKSYGWRQISGIETHREADVVFMPFDRKGERNMRIANRYDTIISKARMNRTAKARAITTKFSSGGISRTSGTSKSYTSKNALSSLLMSKLSGSTNQTAENMAEYQSRIYDYGVVNVASERVAKQLTELAGEGEDSLFARAEASGDYTEIGETLSSVVGDYNLMLRKLKESSDNGDQAYARQLKTEMGKKYLELKALGITSDANGYLTFDEKVFEAADKTGLKDLFGASGGFSESLRKLAGNIESYTLSQQKELQEKMYTSSGLYDQYGQSDWYSQLLGGSSYNAKG